MALLVRLWVAWSTADLPIVRTPRLDSAEYLQWARDILSGNPWPNPPFQGPAYPYMLALLLDWTGSLWGVRLAQGALGAASCVLTAIVGSRWFGRRQGFAAGVLQSVAGPLALWETSLLPEGLLVFLLLLSVLFFAVRSDSRLRLAIAGICLGLAALVRSTALVLVPVWMLVLLMASVSWRERLHRVAMLIAAVTVVLLPTLVHNYRVTGSWQIQAYGGFNFHIGNSPDGTGTAWLRLGRGYGKVKAEAVRQGVETPGDQDAYFLRKTFSEIASSPLAWGRLVASKLAWVIQSEEIRDSHSFYFFTERSPSLGWLPGFGLMFALAMAGFVDTYRRRILPLEMVGYIAGFTATLVLLVVGSRYRMPLVPILATPAGAGLVAIHDSLRQRQFKVVILLAAFTAGGFLLSHARRHDASHNLAEEWALTGLSYNTEKDLGSAVNSHQRAIESDPNSALAWYGLGLTKANLREYDAAEEAFDRALRINPEFSRALLGRALLHRVTGDRARSLEDLRRAADIDPTDPQIRFEVGQELFHAGLMEEAILHLEWTVRRNPLNTTASSMLAQARARR